MVVLQFFSVANKHLSKQFSKL